RSRFRLPPQSSGEFWSAGRGPHDDERFCFLRHCAGAGRNCRRVVLYVILSGKSEGWTGGLGQNGWGAGYLGEYNVLSAFVFEAVATFLFLVCILGVTQD